jgi:D-alanyl-D-alanine carboxypeptidase (penicillin-binding protein 5/6)
VHALLQAVAIASANDAAVALAEHVAGSESAFVERMNRRARRLGCRSTRFTNVHGLDLRRQERAVTTARDLVRIGRALLRHPIALELSSTRRAPFRGGVFWLNTTNKLLGRMDGVDGLKTGWTPRAGGCFCATAERDGVRLVSVVLGAPAGTGRFDVTRRLLEDGFAVAGSPPSERLARPAQAAIVGGLAP